LWYHTERPKCVSVSKNTNVITNRKAFRNK